MANLGIYSWCVDQIQLEEAVSGQTTASTYIKPFESVSNDKGIQKDAMLAVDINELITLIAQFFEVTSAPPSKVLIESHLQSQRSTNDYLKKIDDKKRGIYRQLFKAMRVVDASEEL